ncbi:hypothetical protein M422DRAFT_174675, partial [Sphaerobolus stellatus SS14]
VVSCSSDFTIDVWDAGTGKKVAGPFRGHTGLVQSVVFSPDSLHVVSGSGYHTICVVWDVETRKVIAAPSQSYTDSVISNTFSPNSRHGLSRLMNMEFTDQSIPDKYGWISGVDGGLLFWIPSMHRHYLCCPSTVCIIGGNQTCLDFTHFVHGRG